MEEFKGEQLACAMRAQIKNEGGREKERPFNILKREFTEISPKMCFSRI